MLSMQTVHCLNIFLFPLACQGADIEVDENGTLDLSMKKNRNQEKLTHLNSSTATVPTPSSSPFKTGNILVNTTFYQALCEKEGWDMPINYSKTQGRKEEEKEVFFFLCQFMGPKLYFLSRMNIPSYSCTSSKMYREVNIIH